MQAVELSDVRLESWYLQDGTSSFRLTHLPTELCVGEDRADRNAPLAQRIAALRKDLAARVAGMDNAIAGG